MLMIPSLTQVNDQAFLADDTLIGGYELGGGWLRVERVKIGKRAFVGNSGMAAPGRKVPKASLVAVLSAAPRRKTAQAGRVVAGQPAGPAAAHRRGQRRRPHLRPAHAGSRSPARWSRPAGSCPVALSAGLAAVVAIVLAALLDRSVRRAAGPASSPRRCWRVAGLVAALRHGRGEVAARRPARARRAPAVELVRVAQRAGRHLRRGAWPRRGSPGPSPARRCSTSGSG